MKHICIVTPCYNEEDNVREVYEQVAEVMSSLSGYSYEHLFIDNASTDQTEAILRQIASEDRRVKIILNNRNFGHIQSFQYAILQARGDVVIPISADLQDPPHLIPEFVARWEEGYKVVMGIKIQSEENVLLFALRTFYYRLIRQISDIDLVEHYIGFGLYDRQVIETMRLINDPYPYFRGLIAYMGYKSARLEYVQPARKRGVSKYGFMRLYEMAMLGMTSHSRVPLRLATFIGLSSAIVSVIIGLVNLIVKLLFWESFVVGLAPVAVGLFFIGSVQLFFLGILGEYVGFIYTQILRRPLVIERERINFDD